MSMSCTRPRNCVGFTLLEVLVALVVLTVSIGAVVSQATSLNRNGSHLMHKTYALWVAHTRLAELQLVSSRLAVSDTRGQAEFGARTWYWTQRISNVGGGTALQRIEIAVFAEPVRTTAGGRDVAPLIDLIGFRAAGDNS